MSAAPPLAQIVRVHRLLPHPDAEALDVLDLADGQRLVAHVVTGKHYEAGQLGIFIRQGVMIPGWLAEDLWLVKTCERWVPIEERVMRGVLSDGVYCGSRWRKTPEHPWIDWALWRRRWTVGQDVSAFLGLIPTALDQRQPMTPAEAAKER